MIYCSLLNPSLDVIYDLPELRLGATVTDAVSRMYPSGKGLNIAAVAHALGQDVTVIGQIPEASIKLFKEYLDSMQIQSHLLATHGAARINTTVLESSGQVTHVNAEAAELVPRFQDEIIELYASKIKSNDLWAFSGSVPKGFDADVYAKLIRVCRDKGAVTLLDSRAETLKRGVRAKPKMIKPNLTELEQFFGEQVQGVHHIALKGKRLVDMGVEFVFITLGSDGMIAIHENDCLLCSAPVVKALDTVGCGDALVAGILVGFERQFSFSEMCRMAIACGSSKAMHRGPYNVSRDEIWQLMEDVKVRSI